MAIKQRFYIVLGSLAMACAIAGVFLPLLPATPFALVALWCFARSSPKRHQRLLHSKLLGPYLQNWQDGLGIPRAAKCRALVVLWLSLAVSWYLLPPLVYRWLLLIPGIATSIYLLKQANRPTLHAALTSSCSTTMPEPIIIAAAVIVNSQGQLLLVRKQASRFYMQAGGKLEANESPLQALQRELQEELSISAAESVRALPLGYFECEAANEPGHQVHAHVFVLTLDLHPQAQAELAEAIWVTLDEIESLQLAPLLKQHILPAYRLWQAQSQA
ncbi:DUF454 family protein [Alcaligenes endophyticus]|uniref:DUF454 family protein n=1 Tax=Alcaligenes endophyticus TaxID=1929088 RepID=A0ABT8EKS5_9BURK|nr:DUF454 family protein [Alcaligenes endophyticus]MCX5590827.1 DUF454 family protein [Alcaligenes endophyticus]MDN4121810.1 DUF454 family protein [Alcaligenes endophyticus]